MKGHTPPATRAPESGPMMKDMVEDGLTGATPCESFGLVREFAGRYAWRVWRAPDAFLTRRERNGHRRKPQL
jgi:hypothetical protein